LINRANDNEPYTHILLADTLWLTPSHDALLSTLTQLLARTPSARIHLVAGFHSGRNAIRSFLRKAKAVGLEKKGPEWEEIAVGGEKRKWGWDVEGENLEAGEWIDEKESNAKRGKWVVVGEMGWEEKKVENVKEGR